MSAASLTTAELRPYCWQSKAVLRRIREGFEQENCIPSALAVYLVLTELASNAQADTFRTTHLHISGLSGVSVSSVKSRLAGLVELGLIKIETPAIRAPSTYTLLQRERAGPNAVSQPLPNVSQPLPSDSQRLSIGPLATSEESKKNKEEEEERGRSAHGEKSNGKVRPPLERVETRFPRTEEESELAAGFAGCAIEFAVATWRAAYRLGGRDSHGQAIRNWPLYLKTCWETAARKKNGKLTIAEHREQITVLEKWAKQLKSRYCTESSLGNDWSDKTKLAEFKSLREKIRQHEHAIVAAAP